MKTEKRVDVALPVCVVWTILAFDIEQGRKVQLEVPGVGMVTFKPLTCYRVDGVLYFGGMEIVTDVPAFKLADSQSGMISGIIDERVGHISLRNGPPPLPQKRAATIECGEVMFTRYLVG